MGGQPPLPGTAGGRGRMQETVRQSSFSTLAQARAPSSVGSAPSVSGYSAHSLSRRGISVGLRHMCAAAACNPSGPMVMRPSSGMTAGGRGRRKSSPSVEACFGDPCTAAGLHHLGTPSRVAAQDAPLSVWSFVADILRSRRSNGCCQCCWEGISGCAQLRNSVHAKAVRDGGRPAPSHWVHGL